MQAEGGYVCSAEEKGKIQGTWTTGHQCGDGGPAVEIAAMSGIEPLRAPSSLCWRTVWTRTSIFRRKTLGHHGALPCRDIDHAIELTRNIQAYQGQGHSAGIYSRDDGNIMKLAPVPDILGNG